VKKRCSQPFPVILRTMTLHFDAHWLAYLQTTALSWLLPISFSSGKSFVLAPLSQLLTGETGSIVVVIDALDESGPEPSRSHILSVLGSPRTAKLLSNFRLLIPNVISICSFLSNSKILRTSEREKSAKLL